MASAPGSFLVSIAQAAPQVAEPQLLDIDGTTFVMLGLFLAVTFLLTRWLWRPYLELRASRGSRIEGYREEAARLEAEAASRLARVEAQLALARLAGDQERTRMRSEARSREQEIVARAQAASQRTLADARTRIEAAFASEAKTLQDQATALGAAITERVLGRPA